MKIGLRFAIIIASAIIILFSCFIQIKADTENVSNMSMDERLKNAIVLFVGSPVAYVNNQKTRIDENDQDIYPIISNNSTIVPVRFLSEKIGAKVDWNDNSKTATLTLDGKKIELTLNSNVININGKDEKIDANPVAKNERMFVPVRAIAEAFDKKVFWDKGLIILSDYDNIFDIATEGKMIDELISKVNVLPTVESYDNLTKLLEKCQSYNSYTTGGGALYAEDKVTNGMVNTAKSENAPQEANSSEYSTTNLQVEGVDEADSVKTDGEYIYKIVNGNVVIVKAYPAQNMSVLKTISFEQGKINPVELYVDSKHLVVIGSSYNNVVMPMGAPNITSNVMIRPGYYPGNSTTKAIVYDITDKQNIKEVRQIEIDGDYISSRKIDSALYLVTNKNINFYYIQNQNMKDQILPSYRDTRVSDEVECIPYSKIQYLPNFVEPNYLIIGGINLDNSSDINISAYLGAGRNIYASNDSLFVASENYQPPEILPELNGAVNKLMPIRYYSPDTTVYKFALNDGFVTYNGKGDVRGTIINQFSMDEYNGYFRIATTKGNAWETGENRSKNNVYVLDSKMTVVGKLEDIAPGERIYSTRFIGDRGYMVTFKSVDPFFVIDLKSPANPKVLGELKIPGYSDYLQPYDENHIIGFGRETYEVPLKDYRGTVIGTRVTNGGMKIALFDVNDVNNPKQMFSEKIGDAGTYSEVLDNHKALLFSKSKNLLAFPIEVHESKSITEEGIPAYGDTTFQGAYVYNIDLEKGFVLKGKISHYSDNEIKNFTKNYPDYNKRIDRILFIDNSLYTLSNAMIEANDLTDMNEVNTLKLQ